MDFKKLFRNDTFNGLAVALTAFAVYVATLSPSVAGEEDQGELAAAAYTLGITHPTGYPLFVLLGRVFSLLPLGDLRVIVKLNLMTALFCAAAAFVFYRLLLILLRDNALGPRKPGAGAGESGARAAAAAAALTLAFSKAYWTNALNLEVYGLHLLFLSLVVLLFVLSMRAELDARPDGKRLWLLFAYVLGLSFSHHMMTVLLAPAFLYLYFSVHGFARPAWLKMLRGAPLFLLGLSAYLYLPLRARLHPPLNWDNPETFAEFWYHVSGKQYKAMMFRSVDVPLEKLRLFAERFPGVFGYAPLLLAAAGLWVLFRRDRRLLTFSSLLFAGCLFYALNYDFDDPNFYLNLHFATAIWIGAAIRAILRRVRPGAWAGTAAAAALLTAAFPLAAHYRALDDSGNYANEDYTRNLLASLDSGAVIFTNQSQYFTSVSLYLQHAEGLRRDVAVLQEGSMGFRWYQLQLESRHPELAAKYLRGAAWVPGKLQDSVDFVKRYRRTVWTLIDLSDEIPVYYAPDINIRAFGNVTAFPQGLALKGYISAPPAPRPPREFSVRPFSKQSPDIENIRSYYATAYTNEAILYGNLNDTASTVRMLQKALAVKPGFPEAARLLRWVRGY